MLHVEVEEGRLAAEHPGQSDRSDARRRAGNSLFAWLEEAEPVISRADVRQLLGLASELTGRRLRGARR